MVKEKVVEMLVEKLGKMLGNTRTTSGTLNINTSYMQRRVSSTCAAGSSIRVIAADGTVTCEADNSGAGWTTSDSTTIYNNTASIKVGIGTNTPSTMLEVAGHINVTGASNCIYLPSGGRLCGNTTCTTIYSPNGNTIVEACN